MDAAQPIQEATPYFFVPVAAAYLFACGLWFAIPRLRPEFWPKPAEPATERPWLDLGLVFVVAAAILGIGQLYRAGYLIPSPENEWFSALVWTLNNVIIYSPIAIALVVRKQPPATIYLDPKDWPIKIATGLGIGVLAVLFFLILRGELGRLPDIARRSVSLDALRNFFPVFMEGVALAYAFVRLRWAVGLYTALAIPALLFAAAHVPTSLENERSALYIVSFFLFNTGLTAAILYTVQRSRDIIWIGLVHYLVDIAIDAF